MESSLRHRLGPIAAVVTLSIGCGLVAVMNLFADPAVAPKVEPAEILIARPGENPALAPAKLELSCYDPQIQPVWKELKNDKEFKSRMEGQTGIYDCAGLLEVKHIDLNNDGHDEVLALGKNITLCSTGPSGCGLWVFSNKEDRYRVLLSGSDAGDTANVDDVLRKSRTRGYADLLLKNFIRDYDGPMYSTYVYNGRDYVESRCVVEVPKDERNVGAYETVQCEEYDRRLSAE